MNKSEIVKLSDDKLIEHCEKYRKKLKKERRRHYILQYGWSKEEMDRRGLTE